MTGVQIELTLGDITRQQVDAIVNAANSTLLGGGGVDGAIHRAGGPAVLAACRRLRETTLPAGLPTGSAVATTAGQLPAQWVIHAVGPVYSVRADRSGQLASAYRSCLRVAADCGARSLAFPAISAGAYGWPVHDAARIALQTVRDTPTSVEIARFVLFSQDVYDAFAAAASGRDT